jgi:hypothetical protein
MGWDELKENTIIYGIKSEANAGLPPNDKGRMTDAVASTLYREANKDIATLQGFNATNKRAFSKIPADIRKGLQDLAYTNPSVATTLIRAYRKDKNRYLVTLDSLATDINANPTFGRKILSALEKDPTSLEKTFADYEKARQDRTLAQYIANFGEATPPAAAPAAAEPAPARTETTPAQSTADKAPVVPPPSRPAARTPPPDAAPTTAAPNDPKSDLKAFLAKKENEKFAEEIRRNKLEERLMASITSDQMDMLSSPGQMATLMDMLKNGKTDDFFTQLKGPELPADALNNPGMTGMMDFFKMLTSGEGAKGLFEGDGLKNFADMLGFGDFFGNIQNTAMGSMLRSFGFGEPGIPGAGMSGEKALIAGMLKNPDNYAYIEGKIAGVRGILDAAAANDDGKMSPEQRQLLKERQPRFLQAAGFSKDQIKDVMEKNGTPRLVAYNDAQGKQAYRLQVDFPTQNLPPAIIAASGAGELTFPKIAAVAEQTRMDITPSAENDPKFKKEDMRKVAGSDLTMNTPV